MALPKKGDLSDAEKKLFDVVLKGSVEEMQTLLKEPGVRVDCLDQTGMTLLQHSAFRGRKEHCELLLAHGADVNSNYHENGYSALMFAALSGNTEVTRLMLQAGGNINHINSVNRTATQMAAFVGQHQCVSVINNFFSKEDLDYFTVKHGLEKEPKLPKEVAPALLKFINSVSLHPVKLSFYLNEHRELIKESYKVTKVLDTLVEKNMKSRETNDVLALKMHYLASLIRYISKFLQEKGKDDDLDPWIKSLIKGRDEDGYPEKQDRLICQCLKEFPYVESQLLQQIVRQLASVKVGESSSALSMLVSGINGQQFAFDEDSGCSSCGEPKPDKKCSVCKSVHYCNQHCQKLHWPSHKKFCKQLAEEYKKNEELKKIAEEKERQRKEQEELEKKLKETAVTNKESSESDGVTRTSEESKDPEQMIEQCDEKKQKNNIDTSNSIDKDSTNKEKSSLPDENEKDDS